MYNAVYPAILIPVAKVMQQIEKERVDHNTCSQSAEHILIMEINDDSGNCDSTH